MLMLTLLRDNFPKVFERIIQIGYVCFIVSHARCEYENMEVSNRHLNTHIK